MRNEEVACPHCNELFWISVPDGYNLYKASLDSGGQDNEQKCPKCGKLVFVYLFKKNS